MTSLDLTVGYHRLDTEFLDGYVRHTTFHSDASQGRRRVKVVKEWHRHGKLGHGSYGMVFLEKSGEELRVVKDIAKDSRIDYRRELMAMAILAKHDSLFVQLFGWYESDLYIHIAMEYMSDGDLRKYLEVERSEPEAKAITRQLLEGLFIIHQEGFTHRDLNPANIFVVSKSPIWVKIGDFGLAKLAGNDKGFHTAGGTAGYIAPEMYDTHSEESKYTNAIDIWALGCITLKILTQTLPFKNLGELSRYCLRPELPMEAMFWRNISESGIEFIKRALAYPPDRRITAREALDLEWLRPEQETEIWTRGVLSARAPVWAREANTLPFLPAVDSEYELERSFGEGQALSEKIMEEVASSAVGKSGINLHQTVDTNDSGPYGIAGPRAMKALGAYIPSYLETNQIRPIIAEIASGQAQARADAERLVVGSVESWRGMNPGSLRAELEPVHEATKTGNIESNSSDASSDRMVPFNVSNQLFIIPESKILKYPFSRLADLAAISRDDDVAAIRVPADSFFLLVQYLCINSLPPPLLHPQTLQGTFSALGIPFPTSGLPTNHYQTFMGLTGSLREWSRRPSVRSTRDEYTPDQRSSLARMERGLLTTLDPVHADESDEPRENDNSECHPKAPAVADGRRASLFDACSEALGGEKPQVVVFTAGLGHTEVREWEAAPAEQVMSYPDIPAPQKRLVRISAESSPAEVQELRDRLPGVLGDEFVLDVQEDEQVTIRVTSPMGLYQSETTRGVVVRISARPSKPVTGKAEDSITDSLLQRYTPRYKKKKSNKK